MPTNLRYVPLTKALLDLQPFYFAWIVGVLSNSRIRRFCPKLIAVNMKFLLRDKAFGAY
jgi:hypothetical protein